MKFKYIEEDFKVKEDPCFELKSSGEFACFKLIKKNWNTPSVIETIAKKLRISTKSIGYAGNKDKFAITEQYITIPLSESEVENVENLNLNGVSIKFVGWLTERITLGFLKGNKFKIVVRQCDNEKTFSFDKVKNLYGPQRFGVGNQNVEVGRALLKKNFELACKLLKLEVEDRNFVNILASLDARVLRIYISVYQSWLWNNVANRIENMDELEVFGFLTDCKDDNVAKYYEEILTKEGIKREDFLIKQLKKISMEGTKRKLYLDINNFSYIWESDEMFPGKNKCTLTFELGKGSYATVLIDYLFY